MGKIEKELEKLNILNEPKKVKLRYNKNKSGSVSLYLDYSSNGRAREYLNITLSNNDEHLKSDKDNLRLALNIRDKKEYELITSDNDFKLKKSDIDFLAYYSEISKNKNDAYNCSFRYLKMFYTKDILPTSYLDRSFCDNFARFLENSDIASSTANLYFKKFVAVLNEAERSGLIVKSPAKGIKINHSYSKREFLTEDEIKILMNTPMQVKETKNAFIFACFTGLRLSDLQRLKFSNVKEGYIYIKQKKTEEDLRIKLGPTALRIIEEQQNDTDFVFNLKAKNVVAQTMTRWIKRSGIDKHVTFHCSRHTFATMLLTNGADIYAVSKLIGHKDLATTQIYAKLVDKRKDEAIDLLPDI